MTDNWMKAIRTWGAVGALAIATVLVAPATRAEALFSTGQMTVGNFGLQIDKTLAAPGTLSIKVTDLGVPFTVFDRFVALSFSVTSGGTVLMSHSGEGEIVVDIGAPGSYSFFLAGTPAPRLGLGALSWSANFDATAPVPLPLGAWLLIAGMGWMAAPRALARRLGAFRTTVSRAIGLQRARASIAAFG
jgi:hypothetical protein